jgi:hypothetical protein
MNIKIEQIGPEEWVALWIDSDSKASYLPVAGGKTLTECVQNLEQWEKDRGITPRDTLRRAS